MEVVELRGVAVLFSLVAMQETHQGPWQPVLVHLGLSERAVDAGNRGGIGPEVVALADISAFPGLLADQVTAGVVGEVGGAVLGALLPTQAPIVVTVAGDGSSTSDDCGQSSGRRRVFFTLTTNYQLIPPPQSCDLSTSLL